MPHLDGAQRLSNPFSNPFAALRLNPEILA
jgi:hypothetical protein